MAADGQSPAPDDDDAGDWGPFGRPLFDDPSARALSRVGVVDVGSNSVRMVVFDGAARSPAYFYNEKIMCGLGKGLAQTGRLHPEGKARALSALTLDRGLRSPDRPADRGPPRPSGSSVVRTASLPADRRRDADGLVQPRARPARTTATGAPPRHARACRAR